ncbi:MAG TPA: DNA primase [Polyangiaceae bacterium]|nr:DNA primase [Polyangiaceae bacterium]
MISPDVIDRIRERTSLAELIGQTQKLERRGRSFVGLCPFHKEKSPSFHVNDERGFYHCFGCHASGDVFKFLQNAQGLSFIEAVKMLGERAGIVIEDDLSEDERRRRSAQKRREDDLYGVSRLAAEYFEKMLREHPLARLAHEELGRRGLPYDGTFREVLASFRLGYAPDGWDGLNDYLRAQGADLRAAESVGLLAPRKQGSGFYDRFRHRLMFAVIDLQGRVVAFSGRALPAAGPVAPDAEAPAKYINSPESPIYRKRETVFGLYQARTALRSHPCVLVEGNFDVVSLHARGVAAAVAPLGTAFTVEQGRQIRRFTNDVIFLFDGDAAGKKAVAASRAVCRESGLTARVASLPTGTDPDDFSRERGADALGRVLRAARGMLDHLIHEVLDGEFDQAEAASRAKQVRELIEAEDDPTTRALAQQSYAEKLGARLNVADARTLGALERSALASPRPSDEPVEQAPDRPRHAPNRERSRVRAGEVERGIIGALLDYPELLDSEALLAYSGSMQGDLALAVAALRQAQRRTDRRSAAHATSVPGSSVPSAVPAALPTSLADPSAALAKMPDTIRPFALARLAAPRHTELRRAEDELLSNLRKMQKRDHLRQKQSVAADLERARSEGDRSAEDELLRSLEQRARQRHNLG